MLTPWLIVAAVAGGLALLVVLTHHRRDDLLAGLVGVSGGLVAAQIANVHIFTVLVTLCWLLTPRQRNRGSTASLILLSSIPIALTALVGDLVNNPNLGLQLMALAINGAMIVVRTTRRSAQAMLWGLLLTCSAAAIMSFGQVAGVIPSDGWHADIASLGRPYAFYPEPDWAGLFTGIGVVLAWRLPRSGSKVQVALVMLNAAACALALARATWVGLAAAFALYVLAGALTRRVREKRSGSTRVALALLVGSFTLLAVMPSVQADLYKRVDSLVNPSTSDVSGQARIQQTEGLLRLADTAPWYGHGISASGHVGVSGRYVADSENNLGSNWVISLWVDARLLAIPFILLVVVTAVRRVRTIQGQILVLLVVHNFFSNATFQPITWLILGLALLSPMAIGEDVSYPEDDRDDAEPNHQEHIAR
jgi:hypothetical protein